MRVRLADADLLDQLAAHLRGSGFLVVRFGREMIEAHPLNSVSDRRDRRLLAEQIEWWRGAHPQAEPSID